MGEWIAAEPFQFRGAPRRMTFSGPVPNDVKRCELHLPESLGQYADARVLDLPVETRRGGEKQLRLRLNRQAPSGTYAAELRIGKQAYPAKLDIEAAPRLRVAPLSANFVGKPGTAVEIDLAFANEGNVALIVPETAAVGLYDDNGIEAAFAAMYRLQTDDAGEMFGHLLRKLRAGYGGLLKLHLGGAGPLEPGERRTIAVKTRIPEKFAPRHSYHGIWKFDPVSYRVTVKVLE